MRLHILGIVTVFTVLSALRRLTHAVPAPFDVSVKCDSYGVVVEWMAAGLSAQAEFLLQLKSDFGKNISVSTKYPRYNISDLLLDTAYNQYFVKVKARDGEHESEFAEPQIFSFNFLKEVNITCGLEFPTVNLFPRDGKLFVEFINPLHLYRDTPALRNLQNTDTLKYTVTTLQSNKARAKKIHPRPSFSYTPQCLEFVGCLSGRSFKAGTSNIWPMGHHQHDEGCDPTHQMN
ncbi:hypothetical protein PDJAM_G00161400 [Pangasius djambal]|uniref:Uncharacterized protein n=1 Tax=Pangasius djambal TaxID=1691987 RepID=A0ACC5ZJS6_9TELE|nr:hypothetical protein [Pangasius djambal]